MRCAIFLDSVLFSPPPVFPEPRRRTLVLTLLLSLPQLGRLAKEATKVEQLQEALEEQTRMLEEVSKSVSTYEEDRAAELRRGVERFKELEAALQEAEKEVLMLRNLIRMPS
jgi:hypothetical protein